MNIGNELRKTVFRLRFIGRMLFPKRVTRSVKNKILAGTQKKIIRKKQAFDKNRYPQGINLIGSIKIASGLGQSIRLLANQLEHCKIDYMIYNFEIPKNKTAQNRSFHDQMSGQLKYGINLIHVNPYDVGVLSLYLGLTLWDGRYNIAFWLWELEDFPDEWVEVSRLFDEIWTPSEFIGANLRKKIEIPVYIIPYSVVAVKDVRFDRKFFQLPTDKFLFLCMYDSNSTKERKNVTGAIKAFQKAFLPGDEKVGLVIKLNHVGFQEMELLKKESHPNKNIFLIDRNLSKAETDSLIAGVDVVLSLHRAEGFGLVLAEAMMLGIPCIATNWSANIEFMDSATACMVDYTFIKIVKEHGFYKKGKRWAEADLEQAAGYMVRLKEDREYYEEKSRRAQEYIQNKLKMERIAGLIEDRITNIIKGK